MALIFCKECGKQISDKATTCPNCGCPTKEIEIIEKDTKQSLIECPNCGSSNISVQAVNEKQNTGCFTILIYFILFITVLGWFILIPILLRNKSKTATYSVCQNCGHRWKANKNITPKTEKEKKDETIFAIVATIGIIIFAMMFAIEYVESTNTLNTTNTTTNILQEK